MSASKVQSASDLALFSNRQLPGLWSDSRLYPFSVRLLSHDIATKLKLHASVSVISRAFFPTPSTIAQEITLPSLLPIFDLGGAG